MGMPELYVTESEEGMVTFGYFADG